MRHRLFALFAFLLGQVAAAQGDPEAWIPATVHPPDSSAIDQIVATSDGLFASPGYSPPLYHSADGEVWVPVAYTGDPTFLFEMGTDAAGRLVVGGIGADPARERLYRWADGVWELLLPFPPTDCASATHWYQTIRAIATTPSGALLVGTSCDTRIAIYGEIFRLEDDGATWSLASGYETGYGTVIGFATSAGRVYAARSAGWEGGEPGIQRSDDGAEWTSLPGVPSGYVDGVAASGETVLAIVAPFDTGQPAVYRSADGGATWAATALRVGREQASLLVTTDGAVYAAPGGPFEVGGTSFSGGAVRTRDGGLSWEVLDDGIASLAVTALAADATGRLHAATFDAATQKVGMYRTAGRVVGAGEVPPATPTMLDVAPNPAAGGAQIAFTLAEASTVSLVVTDVLGRRVATVASGAYPSGRHVATWDAGALPAGIYAVTLHAAGRIESRRVTVLR